MDLLLDVPGGIGYEHRWRWSDDVVGPTAAPEEVCAPQKSVHGAQPLNRSIWLQRTNGEPSPWSPRSWVCAVVEWPQKGVAVSIGEAKEEAP
jgi:hypothetical protein